MRSTVWRDAKYFTWCACGLQCWGNPRTVSLYVAARQVDATLAKQAMYTIQNILHGYCKTRLLKHRHLNRHESGLLIGVANIATLRV